MKLPASAENLIETWRLGPASKVTPFATPAYQTGTTGLELKATWQAKIAAL